MDTYMPAIPLGQTIEGRHDRTGGRVQARGICQGRSRAGLFGWEDYTVNGGEGLMGLQKLPRDTDPILALSAARDDRTDRILRHARGRCGEGWRHVRSLGRGRSDRFGVWDDRQDQRMPGSWYRGEDARNATGC